MRSAVLTLTTLAGLPAVAAAQELIRVAYSWQEVVGLTTTPVTNPNSTLDPGEGARMSLTLQALINGTNAIGQTVTYTPPPPPGSGTVKGIGSFAYNLSGDNGAATAAGTWGSRSLSSVFSIDPVGFVTHDGAVLDSFGGGQFVAPGGTANGTNPIVNAFRGVWQPASDTPRTVHFIAEPGTAAPVGEHNSILIAYSITQPSTDPATWYENYFTKYISTDFGGGVSIPIIPAPGAALILALAAIPLRRQRSDAATAADGIPQPPLVGNHQGP